MESISSIKELNHCFVNNKPILFIKKYPEYELRKEGIITSIDYVSNLIVVKTEERVFFKISFNDLQIFIK